MNITTRTMIIIGVVTFLGHVIVAAAGILGDSYVLFTGIFFTLWAVLQIVFPRLYKNNINQMPTYVWRRRKQASSLRDYYDTPEAWADVQNRLLVELNKRGVACDRTNEREWLLRIPDAVQMIRPEVHLRIFEEADRTSLATNVDYQATDFVPWPKLVVAGLLLGATFFGVWASFPLAFAIHFYTMGQLMTMQRGIGRHLERVHEALGTVSASLDTTFE